MKLNSTDMWSKPFFFLLLLFITSDTVLLKVDYLVCLCVCMCLCVSVHVCGGTKV